MSQSHSIQLRREQGCGSHKRARRRRPAVASELLADVPRSEWSTVARGFSRARRRLRTPETFLMCAVSDEGMACPSCYDELDHEPSPEGARCRACGCLLLPWSH